MQAGSMPEGTFGSPIDHPRQWAGYLPDRPALSWADETLSWGELDRRVQRTARFLTEELGLQRGDRVALLARNHGFFFELAYACFRTGLVLAPLNWRLAPPELEQLLALAEPGVLFADEPGMAVAAGLTWTARGRLERLEAYLAAPPASDRPPARPFEGTALEEPALLLFTSGTTGLPKAAVLPARQLFWNGVATRLAFDLRRDDSTVIYTPLFHTGAINVLALPLFQCGGRVILHSGFDAAAILATLARERVTTLFGVPTTFQLLVEHPNWSTTDLGALRLCLCGGAPLPVPLIRTLQARGILLTQGFGMTEVGVNCFFLPPHEALTRAGSVGKPIHHTAARIMVGERMARPEEVGELQLAGPHVCSGYFRNPAATAAVLQDGWFCTGDLARQDADGFYYIAGRKKEMFISGGENVYPAEVELALVTHPAVAEAAVVPLPDPRWGEVGCAFVVVRRTAAGATADPAGDELKAFLRTRLAGYKIPRRFILVPELPRNPSGKVLKEQLRQEALRHAG